jgi:hypothetical protein
VTGGSLEESLLAFLKASIIINDASPNSASREGGNERDPNPFVMTSGKTLRECLTARDEAIIPRGASTASTATLSLGFRDVSREGIDEGSVELTMAITSLALTPVPFVIVDETFPTERASEVPPPTTYCEVAERGIAFEGADVCW